MGRDAGQPGAVHELLKIAATRAEIDPTVTIVSGVPASTIDLDGISVPGRNFSDLTYLQRMYDAGAAPYFDVLAMQGYGLWSGPTDRRMNPRVINFSRPRFVRDVMVRNGDAAKPIWISEMNWNAVPDEIADKRYGQVTLEQQAAYLPMAYDRLQREWPWLGVANTWFLKRATDEWEQQGQPQAYFRLLTADFQPEPVYTAMQKYTASMVPTLYKGYHQEDHWALQYGGVWETVADADAVAGQVKRTEDPQAELAFDMQGSDLILVAPRGPGMGRWIVEIDGRERARLSLDAPTSSPPNVKPSPQPAGRSAASRRPAARGGCRWSDRRCGGSGRLHRPEPQFGVGQWVVLPGDADLHDGDRLHFLSMAGE